MTENIHLGSYGVAPWGAIGSLDGMAACGCRGLEGFAGLGACQGCNGLGATTPTWMQQIQSMLKSGITASDKVWMDAYKKAIANGQRMEKTVRELKTQLTQQQKFGTGVTAVQRQQIVQLQQKLAAAQKQAQAASAMALLLAKKMQGDIATIKAGGAPAMGTSGVDPLTGESFFQKYGMILGVAAVGAAALFFMSKRK